MTRLATAVVLSLLATPAHQAPSANHTLVVRVVEADTERPLRGVDVSVQVIVGRAGYTLRSSTDADGLARIRVVPTGRVIVRVRRQGYYPSDTDDGFGRPVDVGDSPPPATVTIRLARGGAITGRVLDEFGEPMAGIQVKLIGRRPAAGSTLSAASSAATTDDRGEYRFASLRPGGYIVGVTPSYVPRALSTMPRERMTAFEWTNLLQGWSGDDEPVATGAAPLPAPVPGLGPIGYTATFYPGVDESDAHVVHVEPGRTSAEASFSMRTAPMGFVTGTLSGTSGIAIKFRSVVLVPAAGGDIATPIPAAAMDSEGRFLMPFVPYGNYTLVASATAAEFDQIYSTRLPIVVDGRSSASTLDVPLSAGYRLKGRISVHPAVRPASLPVRPGVRFVKAGGGPALVILVEADGTFAYSGLPPGRYEVSPAGLPVGWHAISAKAGTREVFDDYLEVDMGTPPLEIVIGNNLPTLAGDVRASGGEPTSAGWIIVFPAERRPVRSGSPRVRAVRPGPDGRFAMAGLPPGRYLVVAAEALPDQWHDPAFLESLVAHATPISLELGAAAAISLTRRAAR